MKISVVGIDNFPIGKKKLTDERVDRLAEILYPAKTTYISLETVPEENLLESEAIICLKEKKLDLIIKDLELIEEKLFVESAQKENFQKAKEVLEKEKLLSENLDQNVKNMLKDFQLVTLKPTLFVEKDDSDFDRMLEKAYQMLDMICFFTANEKELRAWPIKKGTTAIEAAGKIHTDIQRGFIKAEVAKAKDLLEFKHLNELKSRNLISLKDRDYIVEDADLIKFRFNV